MEERVQSSPPFAELFELAFANSFLINHEKIDALLYSFNTDLDALSRYSSCCKCTRLIKDNKSNKLDQTRITEASVDYVSLR